MNISSDHQEPGFVFAAGGVVFRAELDAGGGDSVVTATQPRDDAVTEEVSALEVQRVSAAHRAAGTVILCITLLFLQLRYNPHSVIWIFNSH